ncbi:MAG: arginine deiminase-related protein [Steroidobacteraceae bacterium]|jgi:hypothetical protein
MLKRSDSGTPESARRIIQCAPAVLLVRPAAFGCNPQTAASNRFQRQAPPEEPSQSLALVEFERLRCALQANGVRTCVALDTREPLKPDAVFPNNWVSFHRDGTIVLYPMQAANRRPERRMDILTAVEQELNFSRRRLLDLSHEELRGRFLEGTGSLVLDHVERVAYACRSPRTDESLVREWARIMDYETEVFDATDRGGAPIYHTNVMLAIGTRCAVVCSEVLARSDRSRVLGRLHASRREILEIDIAAMQAFAGNVLELRAPAGAATELALLVTSSAVRAGLGERLWAQLCGAVDRVLELAVPTIETLGGGSVRCMLAEVPECAA